MIFSTRHLENNSIFDFNDISLSSVQIVNNEEPDNLHELVPPLVAANVNHNLRSSHN